MTYPLHLFEGYGVELEYMLVERDTLNVLPISDRVLHAIAGAYESEVEVGPLSWSNELVLHVIELKTNGPAAALDGLAELFQHDVGRINDLAAASGGMLMPTAMHPWMDPASETRLWPHEFSPVYEAFNRVFDCRGHGWSNLQCTHLNLPFGDDENEFGRLHAAIRLILPILPALAASSPLADGQLSGFADTRLDVYRGNARRIPSVGGRVVPEPVFSRRAYDEHIFQPLYRDIAPHDPEGTLRYEWLNARGAIARFDRGAIEIRVLDIQECPQADLAILMLITAALRALVEERWCSYAQQQAWSEVPLAEILLPVVRDADETIIESRDYTQVFGWSTGRCKASELWQHLLELLFDGTARQSPALAPLHVILNEGCLARRITRAVGPKPDRSALMNVYREICRCLATGVLFRP
jgi:carboxylate-amine ligase